MFKIIAAAALLSGVSTMVAVQASDSSGAARLAFKADRLERQTETGVRNYLSPRLDGKAVAFCLANGTRCGKDAADAFCRHNGFEEAITFQRDGAQPDLARLLFHQIKCRRSVAAAAVQNVITEFAGTITQSNAAAKSDRL